MIKLRHLLFCICAKYGLFFTMLKKKLNSNNVTALLSFFLQKIDKPLSFLTTNLFFAHARQGYGLTVSMHLVMRTDFQMSRHWRDIKLAPRVNRGKKMTEFPHLKRSRSRITTRKKVK